MSSSDPILIVGGGLGGLTAALALAWRGRAARVLEGAPEFGAIGYGIQFGPNIFHVLDRIGVTDRVLAEFDAGRADVVTLIYSRFRSVVQQIPTARQLIPAVVDAETAAPDLQGAAYEYEPSEEETLDTLLPRNITVQVLAALLENMAGFYASQMSAMDNATRNAGDMIAALNLQYNRQRQARITTELIEIISAAAAL